MNIEQIADAVSKEMLGNVATLQPELVKCNREYLSSCLSKLVEQADMEPVAWQGKSGHLVYDKAALMPITRNLATPLYTEAQLLAAQQRTAEACAKVCENETDEQWIDSDAWYAAKNCRDQIRNGDWREYL